MPAPMTRRFRVRRLLILAVALLGGALWVAPAGAGGGEPAWSTYHHDAERSGSDPDATSPLTPALSWQSPNLGAPIWGQPLILGSRVYVSTVGDGVFALDASTGQVAWHQSAGTPVPSSRLPCGDITPSVGIVGTPVIDVAAGVLYAVADTWNGSQAQHVLEGFRVGNGERVLSTVVDPPGSDPDALLQRTALNLDNGSVIFGFGGNDGDCSDYRGAVASVPENGGAPSFWQVPIASPSSFGGAVWATGGPAVDGAGNVYASTGNPNPPSGREASTYDYSDSVVELNRSLSLTGHFEPPSWKADSNSDLDLGSGAPELLPGGLLFEAGKNGTGYLIDESTLSSGAAAVYSARVCGGHGSFGGDSYSNGVIYIPCTDGTQALSYNASARTFTPLWQGPADAFGPPIVSGGLVWTLATGGFSGGGTKLYGLEPATGKPRYTEQLPSPIADHFASPSAAGGHLLIATGSTVSAYQVALPSAGAGGGAAPSGAPPVVAPGAGHAGSGSQLVPVLLARNLRASVKGAVRVLLRCSAPLSCRGTITMSTPVSVLVGRPGHRHHELVRLTLARASFSARRGGFAVTLHLNSRARALLRRHHRRLRVTLAIVAKGAGVRKVDALLVGSR
jgi:outer membrane protein assembly factor BamB